MAKGKIVTVPAGPGDTRSGLDVEVDSNETEVDPENTGFQSMIPGASAARTVRPGTALVRLYDRLEVSFDYYIRDWAAGYILALLLRSWACQPLQFSSADHLWERVLCWDQSFVI